MKISYLGDKKPRLTCGDEVWFNGDRFKVVSLKKVKSGYDLLLRETVGGQPWENRMLKPDKREIARLERAGIV